jgi:uncharacterized protein (TIGR02594 family)
MQWLMYLLRAFFGGAVEAPKVPTPPEEPVKGDPAWLKLARAELGVKEVVGPQHNPTVIGYFRDAGFPEIDTDETAWCAGFANAMLERSGAPGSKSLAARSFLTWGKPITKPYPGCIAVFSRGDPRSWEGHVGFFVSEDGDKINVLGGNQSNQVSIAAQARGRLLGYRAPGSASNSRTMKASTAQMGLLGLDGVAILESQGQINVIGDLIGQIGLTIPALLVGSILLKIALQCVIIYARQDDAQKKGR